MYEKPSPKLTYHAVPDEPAYGEDVQNHCAGVLGNAFWLIAGGEVTVMSTIDCNSVSVGKRQPEPSRVSPAQ
jgi:hypothetical protein